MSVWFATAVHSPTNPAPREIAGRMPGRGRGAVPAFLAYAPALLVAGAVAFCPLEIRAQDKPDAGVRAAPKLEGTAARPTGDVPGSVGFEQSIQHGFFGDLSRPAPPAINRIEGIRIPESAPPGQEKSAQTPALSSPVSAGTDATPAEKHAEPSAQTSTGQANRPPDRVGPAAKPAPEPPARVD